MTRFNTTSPGQTPAWLLCSLPLALAAFDRAGGPATTMVVDSAGIPITTALAPVWGPGDEWTISEEPVVQIGRVDGPAEYLLGSVSRAVRLTNGDIVLGDWSNNVLRRYDGEGVFVWEASRQGEGPGEHLRLLWVGALASDSIVTWDGVLRRVQIFGPNGVVGRTFRVEAPWSDFAPSAVQGIWGRNLVMSFHDYRGEMPEGVVRWPGVRYATVSLDDGEVARLIDVAGREQEITSYPGGQVAYTGYQYGKGPLSTVQAGALAVVDTRRSRSDRSRCATGPHHGFSGATSPSCRSPKSTWTPSWTGWSGGTRCGAGCRRRRRRPRGRPGAICPWLRRCPC